MRVSILIWFVEILQILKNRGWVLGGKSIYVHISIVHLYAHCWKFKMKIGIDVLPVTQCRNNSKHVCI